MLSHLEWEHAVVVFEWVDFNILSNHSLCICVCVVFFFVFQYIKFLNVRTVILVVELNVDAWKWKHCVCVCVWTVYVNKRSWTHLRYYGILSNEREIIVLCALNSLQLQCAAQKFICDPERKGKKMEFSRLMIQLYIAIDFIWIRFKLVFFSYGFFFLCVLLLERPNVYFMRVTQPRRRWLRQRQLQFNSIFFVW